MIGLSNTIITLAVFYVLNTLCGFPYGVSNVTGYILGVINSFIWNRTWVFKSHGKMTHQMMLFIVG
ncbi:MAG: GtrA family protein, partial [Muribaculaceae bacterium]|nr:GtrA family protein [Muribaculaceae bacterium]